MSDQDPVDDQGFHKQIAASCNNAAWALVEKPVLDVTEVARLVTLAATASHHWNAIGTPSNIAHAGVLFAWAPARAGSGPAAVHVAGAALAFSEAGDTAPWERAFAHAAMAAACHANDDTDGYRRHYAKAQELASQLSGDDAQYFQAAFRTVPIGPGGEQAQ